MFFGDNKKKATFTLEEDPIEEHILRITHKAKTISYNENSRSSCRVFDNQLYAFPDNHYLTVFSYGLGDEEWQLFVSSDWMIE